MGNKFYLGFDIGGKRVRGVIADSEGQFEENHVIKEDGDRKNGPLGISSQLIRIAKRCSDLRGISLEDITTSAICSAGPLDMEEFDGCIKDSTNIKFPEVDDLNLNELPGGWVYDGHPLVVEDSIKTTESGKKFRHVCIPLVDPVSKAIGKKPI